MVRKEGFVAKMMDHVDKDRYHIRCQDFRWRVSQDASEPELPRFEAHVERISVAVFIRNDVLTSVADTADNTGIVGVFIRPVDLDAVNSDGIG